MRFTLDVQALVKRKKIINKFRTFDPRLFRCTIESAKWSTASTLAEKFDQIQQQLAKCADAAASAKPKSTSRLSEETHQLLKERKELNCQANSVAFVELLKLIRRKVKEDHESYRRNKLLIAAEQRISLKKCKRQL